MAENEGPLQITEARVNITYKGLNGYLPDPVASNASPADVKTWVQEALRTGGIPGIPIDPTANLQDFQVDPCAPTDAQPYPLFMVRPKAIYG